MRTRLELLTPAAVSLVAAVAIAAATGAIELAPGDAQASAASAKGDRLEVAGAPPCDRQAWPNLSADCLVGPDGERIVIPARTITIATHDSHRALTRLTRVSVATTK